MEGDFSPCASKCRPIARMFGRGVTSISDVHEHTKIGKIDKLDALRLLLRPFWDRSRAIVATQSAEYCIQFSPVSYPCVDVTSQLTFLLSLEK